MSKFDISEPVAVIRAQMREIIALDSAQSEAHQIVVQEAEACASGVRAEFEQHRVTGTLASRVRVSYQAPLVGKVIAAAPHAAIFEKGTRERFHKTSGKSVGASPAHRTLARTAPGHRARLKHRLADLLRRHGLTVTE